MRSQPSQYWVNKVALRLGKWYHVWLYWQTNNQHARRRGKPVSIKLRGEALLIRVGGGFVTLDMYLGTYFQKDSGKMVGYLCDEQR